MAVLLAVVTYLVLTPLALTLLNSFQLARPGQPPVYSLAAWVRVFTDRSILSALANTVALTLVRQPLSLVLGILFAWLIARTDLPSKSELEFMFWLSFFLPALPVTMGWMLLLGGKF